MRLAGLTFCIVLGSTLSGSHAMTSSLPAQCAYFSFSGVKTKTESVPAEPTRDAQIVVAGRPFTGTLLLGSIGGEPFTVGPGGLADVRIHVLRGWAEGRAV